MALYIVRGSGEHKWSAQKWWSREFQEGLVYQCRVQRAPAKIPWGWQCGKPISSCRSEGMRGGNDVTEPRKGCSSERKAA